ncbi:hypothetical protein [Actinomadura flavalba]|uniref:hypothetical protein n=1 Tax=Actinomadura flavalba TaxID=1120938 RepID=UPI0003752505|nr:hypothetical protein [Actinomadura flavalba]
MIDARTGAPREERAVISRQGDERWHTPGRVLFSSLVVGAGWRDVAPARRG